MGTDNQALLDDPMYLGQPHKRIRGQEYDAFIEKFVRQVKVHFPNAVLQWEDFSKSNAFNNLSRYQQELPSFNDDIQGTGAVVLAGIIGAVRSKGETLGQQNYLVYGAGAGGVGVADQIYAGMLREGLEPQAARIASIFSIRKAWCVITAIIWMSTSAAMPSRARCWKCGVLKSRAKLI
ncbi:hypothetical protein PCI56_12000 [Plesiomonas shigelloides subsp. oncorhynchi]|nr:hypothetical protein [Plesiomonas shigelloides]